MAEKRIDSFSSAILNIFHPQPPLLILAYFPNFPIFYFPIFLFSLTSIVWFSSMFKAILLLAGGQLAET